MIKYKQNLALKRHGWKADARRADRNISYCNSCNQCWESIETKEYLRGTHKIIYLVDFPTYGKKKATCPKCK